MHNRIKSIDVYGLNQRMQNGDHLFLLDVRSKEEVAFCRLANSVAIPIDSISARLDLIPDDVDIVIYCHHGVRSKVVAHYLSNAGFDINRLFNLSGGIDAFAKCIDSSIPRYQ